MIVRMRKEGCNSWNGLVELISSINMDNITMVEVGSYAGESAGIFASSGKITEIHCVDPWTAGYGDNSLAEKSDFTEVEAAFDAVVESYPSKIRKFKGTFEDFVNSNPDVHPDLIYIDACHTYEGCKQDISTALKLNPSFISGHDYTDCWPGVKQSVEEMFGTPDGTFVDGSWIVDLRKRR